MNMAREGVLSMKNTNQQENYQGALTHQENTQWTYHLRWPLLNNDGCHHLQGYALWHHSRDLRQYRSFHKQSCGDRGRLLNWKI